MSPGFLLVITVVGLGAVSPIVLAVAMACLFFPPAIWVARTVTRFGSIGILLGAAGWFLVTIVAKQPMPLSWQEGAILCAAGFSAVAIFGILATVIARRRSRPTHHSSGPPSAAAELKRWASD